MGVADSADPAGNGGDPLARLDSDHLAQMGIVAQQRREPALGEQGDSGAGITGPELPEQRSREQDVPDGAEAHHEDVGGGEEGIHGDLMYLSFMPRPKSILWVDDEVESLTSHILFLEEQGFAVETSAHGDDALALLRQEK